MGLSKAIGIGSFMVTINQKGVIRVRRLFKLIFIRLTTGVIGFSDRFYDIIGLLTFKDSGLMKRIARLLINGQLRPVCRIDFL